MELASLIQRVETWYGHTGTLTATHYLALARILFTCLPFTSTRSFCIASSARSPAGPGRFDCADPEKAEPWQYFLVRFAT